MDELFAQYERELVTLRQLCQEYAQRYPKMAARLQLGGEACEDPHVERLIQAVALLCARVSKRLDDSYPQFTEALLELLLPHFLRPFPSCAIARFAPLPGQATVAGGNTIARGTLLESSPLGAVQCKFQTAYDVTLAPVAVACARFDEVIRAPSATRLPKGATASISIELKSGPPLSGPGMPFLRIYLNGDASFCAAVRDALFMRSALAFVQLGASSWMPVPAMPISAVGFGAGEALIPFGARSHSAYRILSEYFAFPEKFNFFDINLGALCALLPGDCTVLTLHLALTGILPDSDQARMLDGLSAQNLVLGCTPIVNLFTQPGVPIAFDERRAEYTVLPHSSNASAFEVYSVDGVHMVQPRGNGVEAIEFRPFYSLRHGDGGQHKGRYWLLRHDETMAISSPGHEKTISLVDADCAPFAVEKSALSIELSCTNRDLPSRLPCGAPGGDLFLPGATQNATIDFLRRPTRAHRLRHGPDAHWRLISHLALNHRALAQDGAAGLREMLTLYDPIRSAVSQRQIAGIMTLELADSTAWIRHERGPSLVHGTQIRLTLDEEAFAGSGLQLFVQVIDQFFALYVQMNSFVELVVLSYQTGEELFRCTPRSGSMKLL